MNNFSWKKLLIAFIALILLVVLTLFVIRISKTKKPNQNQLTPSTTINIPSISPTPNNSLLKTYRNEEFGF